MVSQAFAVNMPDVTRYSKSPRGAAISQAVLLPVVITLGEFVTIQRKKESYTNQLEKLNSSEVIYPYTHGPTTTNLRQLC